MAEITYKRSGELLRGVFKILLGEPDGLPSREVLTRLEKEVVPTDYENGAYPATPGRRRYETQVRFSTINSVKAGWLTKDRRRWVLTEAGKAAYESTTDPEQFFRESQKGYRQWADGQPQKETDNDGESEQDDAETPSQTLDEAAENAWAEVEKYLTTMPPYDLQEVVAGLLEGMGYYIEWIAPPGPDGGIDIHATTDPLGISGKHIKVQVKRKREAVAVEAIRSFRDTLKERDTGLYISISGFTKDSEKEARIGQRHLILVDAERFFDLWISHYEKIPERRRRLLPIKLVAFLDMQ